MMLMYVGFLREGLHSRQKRSAVRTHLVRRFARYVDIAARERCVATTVECSRAADNAAR